MPLLTVDSVCEEALRRLLDRSSTGRLRLRHGRTLVHRVRVQRLRQWIIRLRHLQITHRVRVLFKMARANVPALTLGLPQRRLKLLRIESVAQAIKVSRQLVDTVGRHGAVALKIRVPHSSLIASAYELILELIVHIILLLQQRKHSILLIQLDDA